MKVLLVVGDYPHPAHPFGGIFNQKCASALRESCDYVEVLAPRPYAPPLLSTLVPRWDIYARIAPYYLKDGVPVHRPVYFQLPRIGGAFCVDQGAYLCCRRMIRKRHHRVKFDAVMSFDLGAAGGLAWRLGEDLGIPASGWATGSDVRSPARSSRGTAVVRALQRLDVVFYQSHELLEKAAALLDKSPEEMSPDRHVVLPRGIPEPPLLPRVEVRRRERRALGIGDDQILVLNIGRVSRAKGVFDLLRAISLAVAEDPRIMCVVVGSMPAFDETAAARQVLTQEAGLKNHVRLLPACNPDRVWDYLCAADMFAFASHHEGMPNSLLEAMAMAVPAVAFAIPAVSEIEDGTGSLVTVPPFEPGLFAEEILRLASSPEARAHTGQKGSVLVRGRFSVQKNMAEALRRLPRPLDQKR